MIAIVKYTGIKPEPGQKIAITRNGKVRAAIYNTKSVIGRRSMNEPETIPSGSIVGIIKNELTVVKVCN